MLAIPCGRSIENNMIIKRSAAIQNINIWSLTSLYELIKCGFHTLCSVSISRMHNILRALYCSIGFLKEAGFGLRCAENLADKKKKVILGPQLCEFDYSCQSSYFAYSTSSNAFTIYELVKRKLVHFNFSVRFLLNT